MIGDTNIRDYQLKDVNGEVYGMTVQEALTGVGKEDSVLVGRNLAKFDGDAGTVSLQDINELQKDGKLNDFLGKCNPQERSSVFELIRKNAGNSFDSIVKELNIDQLNQFRTHLMGFEDHGNEASGIPGQLKSIDRAETAQTSPAQRMRKATNLMSQEPPNFEALKAAIDNGLLDGLSESNQRTILNNAFGLLKDANIGSENELNENQIALVEALSYGIGEGKISEETVQKFLEEKQKSGNVHMSVLANKLAPEFSELIAVRKEEQALAAAKNTATLDLSSANMGNLNEFLESAFSAASPKTQPAAPSPQPPLAAAVLPASAPPPVAAAVPPPPAAASGSGVPPESGDTAAPPPAAPVPPQSPPAGQPAPPPVVASDDPGKGANPTSGSETSGGSPASASPQSAAQTVNFQQSTLPSIEFLTNNKITDNANTRIDTKINTYRAPVEMRSITVSRGTGNQRNIGITIDDKPVSVTFDANFKDNKIYIDGESYDVQGTNPVSFQTEDGMTHYLGFNGTSWTYGNETQSSISSLTA
jgi:hypothetical protein